jgi:hypothetical protein
VRVAGGVGILHVLDVDDVDASKGADTALGRSKLYMVIVSLLLLSIVYLDSYWIWISSIGILPVFCLLLC